MFKIINYKFNYPFRNLFLSQCKFLSELPYKNFVENNRPVQSDLDFTYLCSSENTVDIKRSMQIRKATGNIDKVIELYNELLQCKFLEKRNQIEQELISEASKIPNRSHPSLRALKDVPKIVKSVSSSREWPFKPLTFEVLVKKLNLLKNEYLTNLTGPRSYFLTDGLSALEEALIQYTLKNLLERKYRLVSVPDLLPRTTIESCGMETRGERTQVINFFFL